MSPRTRVELPSHIPATFEVYVNGVRQEAGRDYVLEGRSLVFRRPLAEEGKFGFWRWATMWLAGSYRKNETVDVVYERNGRREVETGLPRVADA